MGAAHWTNDIYLALAQLGHTVVLSGIVEMALEFTWKQSRAELDRNLNRRCT
jgi:hypothetical protein